MRLMVVVKQINTGPIPPNLIKNLGTKLIDLLAMHPAIKEQVVPLLDQKNQAEGPIYLLLKDPALEHAPVGGAVHVQRRVCVVRPIGGPWLARRRSTRNSSNRKRSSFHR